MGKNTFNKQCVVSQNIHTSHKEGVLGSPWPFYSSPLKVLPFETPPPSPASSTAVYTMTLHGVVYEYFLELCSMA